MFLLMVYKAQPVPWEGRAEFPYSGEHQPRGVRSRTVLSLDAPHLPSTVHGNKHMLQKYVEWMNTTLLLRPWWKGALEASSG